MEGTTVTSIDKGTATGTASLLRQTGLLPLCAARAAWRSARSLDHNEALALTIVAVLIHLQARLLVGLANMLAYAPDAFPDSLSWVAAVGLLLRLRRARDQ